jgi:hypothetical protein
MEGDKNAYILGGKPEDNRPFKRPCGRLTIKWFGE